MFYRDVITLIAVTQTTNSIGDPVQTKTKRDVFADRQGVRQSEFYQALATGIRPELMFVIKAIDYSQEGLIEYNSKEYSVIRTGNKDGENIELVCQGLLGGVN
jgi:SPP1 family predicted phage head-tail adaptor